MATNNRGTGNRSRGSKNNNPQGHNQYDRGWVDTAKERPMATAAAAAAAVGAGVFLWSRRNQISDQISYLSDQISEWTQSMSSGMGGDSDSDMGADDTGGLTVGETLGKSGNKGRVGRTSNSRGSNRTITTPMAETADANS